MSAEVIRDDVNHERDVQNLKCDGYASRAFESDGRCCRACGDPEQL